jgi:hypothetical protein
MDGCGTSFATSLKSERNDFTPLQRSRPHPLPLPKGEGVAQLGEARSIHLLSLWERIEVRAVRVNTVSSKEVSEQWLKR